MHAFPPGRLLATLDESLRVPHLSTYNPLLWY